MDSIVNVFGYVLYPLIAFLISLSLTAVCIRVLPKLGFIDNPGGRHIHQRVVPRGGGVAIALAVLFASAAQLISRHDAGGVQLLLKAMLPGGLIIITGLIDDRIELKSGVKLLLQIVAAFLVWYGTQPEFTICCYVLPWYVSLGVTVLWIVGVINAFNMIDGLDGLATGLAVISGLCLSVWFLFRQGGQALYMLIFVGACLGFLCYNFAPAKIFLGDTGSMFLGMFLAVAGGSTLDITATFTTLLLPPLIIGVPIFDMVLAVLRRSIRKKLNPGSAGLMDADSDHLHHRLFRQNHSHRKSAVRMYVIGMVFASMALLLLLLRDRAAAVALSVILVALLIMLRRLAVIELHDSVSLLRESLSHPRKSLLCMAVHPLLDMVMIVAATLVSCFVITGTLRGKFAAFAVLPVLVTLALAGNYRVFWLRAAVSDRVRLFISAIAGSLLSGGVLYYGQYAGKYQVTGNFAVGITLFVMLVPMLLSAERFFLHYFESFWYSRFIMHYRHSGTSQMLLIGGGLRSRLAINFFNSCRRESNRVNIIGVLDDEPRLTGRNSYDLPVLGKIDELEAVYNRCKFDRVLITMAELPEERVAAIREFCRKNAVKCAKFSIFGPGIPQHGRRIVNSIGNTWFFMFDVAGLLLASGICSWLLFGRVFTWYAASVAVVSGACMVLTGVYRQWWVRAGSGARWKLLKSIAFGGVAGHALYACWLMFSGGRIEESDFVATALIFILMTGYWMQALRLCLHPVVFLRRGRSRADDEKVLIYGGGLFCRIYLQALYTLAPRKQVKVVGIIDDDTVLHGLRCHGVPVRGGIPALENVYNKYKFDRILIASNRISGASLTAVGKFADAHGIPCSNFVISQQQL